MGPDPTNKVGHAKIRLFVNTLIANVLYLLAGIVQIWFLRVTCQVQYTWLTKQLWICRNFFGTLLVPGGS